jgi:hypothetical protein
MTGRRDQARHLADLAEMLTEVDEFLRSPAGHAALDQWYQARGLPAYRPGCLIDWVSFTLFGLREHAGQDPQHS